MYVDGYNILFSFPLPPFYDIESKAYTDSTFGIEIEKAYLAERDFNEPFNRYELKFQFPPRAKRMRLYLLIMVCY